MFRKQKGVRWKAGSGGEQAVSIWFPAGRFTSFALHDYIGVAADNINKQFRGFLKRNAVIFIILQILQK